MNCLEKGLMQKYLLRRFFVCVSFVACISFFSCTPTMEVQAQADGSYIISYDVTLGKVFMDTVASVADASTASSPFSVFDATVFQSQLSSAGLSNVSVKTPSANQLSISTPITENGRDIFSKAKLISIERVSGKKTMTLMLSPESVQAIYNTLPDVTRSYIDLFMAPVFTGDYMPKSEYVELVSMVYGKALTDELLGASISLVLASPNKKAQQRFSVSLVDLMLLEKPMLFSVSW